MNAIIQLSNFINYKKLENSMNRLMKKFNILGDQRLYTMRISDAVNKHKLPKLPNNRY